jgi:hypothetical protein
MKLHYPLKGTYSKPMQYVKHSELLGRVKKKKKKKKKNLRLAALAPM